MVARVPLTELSQLGDWNRNRNIKFKNPKVILFNSTKYQLTFKSGLMFTCYALLFFSCVQNVGVLQGSLSELPYVHTLDSDRRYSNVSRMRYLVTTNYILMRWWKVLLSCRLYCNRLRYIVTVHIRKDLGIFAIAKEGPLRTTSSRDEFISCNGY